MRRYTWALAIVCFLVILLAAPLLFSDRYSRLTLQSGAVFARLHAPAPTRKR